MYSRKYTIFIASMLSLACHAAISSENETIDDVLGWDKTSFAPTDYWIVQKWPQNTLSSQTYQIELTSNTLRYPDFKFPDDVKNATLVFFGSTTSVLGLDLPAHIGNTSYTNLSFGVPAYQSSFIADDVARPTVVHVYVNTSLELDPRYFELQMRFPFLYLFDLHEIDINEPEPNASLGPASPHHLTKRTVSIIVGTAAGVSCLIAVFVALIWRRRRLHRRHWDKGASRGFVLEAPDMPPKLSPTDVDLFILSSVSPPAGPASRTGLSMVQTQATLPSYRSFDRNKAPTYCTNATVPTTVFKQ